VIVALAEAVGLALAAKGFAIPVRFGPDRLARSAHESAIVVDYDRASGDTFAPVQGAVRNPRHTAVRGMGARAMIWARSGLPGAREQDHVRACDQIVDAFYCAVNAWMAQHSRVATFTVGQAGYLPSGPESGGEWEAWPGVVYQFRWSVPRGVIDRDYVGAALPEGTITSTSGSVQIRRNADDIPEIVEIP